MKEFFKSYTFKAFLQMRDARRNGGKHLIARVRATPHVQLPRQLQNVAPDCALRLADFSIRVVRGGRLVAHEPRQRVRGVSG